MIAARALRMKYAAHTTIIRAGAIPKRLSILRSGTVSRLYSLDNHLIPVEHLHRGALWGHAALIQPSTSINDLYRTDMHGAETIEIPIIDLLALFEQYPEIAATVAHNLLKFQSKQKTHDDLILSCLYGVNHMLQSAGTPQDKWAATLRLAADTLGARSAFIARFDPLAHRIHIVAHLQTPSLAGTSFSLLADTLLATVFTTRTSLIVGPHSRERKFMHVPYFRQTMAIAPLIANTNVIGAIALTDSVRYEGFTTHDSECLNVIGGLLAQALITVQEQENQNQQAQLKRSYIGNMHNLE